MKLLSVCHFVLTLVSQIQLNKEKIYNLFIPHKKSIIKVKILFDLHFIYFFSQKQKIYKILSRPPFHDQVQV